MKRSRGRGRRQQNPVNRSYDSNGPDVRVRGTASQVYEKYQALARDAMASGDRVMAENYSQHAEHYYRIVLSFQPAPGEGDKEAVNGEAERDGANGDASGNEPLVLVRDGNDANGDESGDAKPAKPSRRRGPLRKKRAEDADKAGDEKAANGAAEVEADVAVVAATTTAKDADAEAAPESETASAE